MSETLSFPRNICERSINFKAFIHEIKVKWRDVKSFGLQVAGCGLLDTGYALRVTGGLVAISA